MTTKHLLQDVNQNEKNASITNGIGQNVTSQRKVVLWNNLPNLSGKLIRVKGSIEPSGCKLTK